MKRNILVFGTIAGVIVSTFMAISMYMMSKGSGDMEHGGKAMVIGFASMAVAFSFVFVGIKNYRDKQNGGRISFGQAFLLGCMISVLASTFYVLTWAIEFHFFLPDFIDKYSAMEIRQVQASGLPPAELGEKIRDIEKANYNYKHNPFFFALYTYAEILPVGILITLISALILKRKRPGETQVVI